MKTIKIFDEHVLKIAKDNVWNLLSEEDKKEQLKIAIKQWEDRLLQIAEESYILTKE